MLSRILKRINFNPSKGLRLISKPQPLQRNIYQSALNSYSLQRSFQKNPKSNFKAKIFRSFSSAETRETVPQEEKVTQEDFPVELKSILEDPEALKELVQKYEFVQEGKEKVIGYWLLALAGIVAAMIALGGYTRLSKSGLSMTKWKPIGYKYPQTREEWEEEFESYKVTIKKINFFLKRNIQSTDCPRMKSTSKDSNLFSSLNTPIDS